MDQLTEQEQRIAGLQQQLSEVVTAERFFEQDTGRLWKDLAVEEINRLVKDISSDKYLKDHAGYVNANIELRVWQKMLRKMQIAGSPIRRAKLQERLAEDGQSE